MQSIADELHELWLNGKTTRVINEVTSKSKAKCALLGALLACAMSANDRMTFLAMLMARVNKE